MFVRSVTRKGMERYMELEDSFILSNGDSLVLLRNRGQEGDMKLLKMISTMVHATRWVKVFYNPGKTFDVKAE